MRGLSLVMKSGVYFSVAMHRLLTSVVEHGPLGTQDPVYLARELSCLTACSIFPDQRWNVGVCVCPALADKFLTIESPGMPTNNAVLKVNFNVLLH